MVNVNFINIRVYSEIFEIRKYKKRFNFEIFCVVFWGKSGSGRRRGVWCVFGFLVR